MKRKSVISSAVASIGYDAASKTLEVELTNGRIYRYLHVEKNVFAGFMRADSKGTYFGDQVRDAYQFVRVR